MNRFEYINKTIMTPLKKKPAAYSNRRLRLDNKPQALPFCSFPIQSLSQYFDF